MKDINITCYKQLEQWRHTIVKLLTWLLSAEWGMLSNNSTRRKEYKSWFLPKTLTARIAPTRWTIKSSWNFFIVIKATFQHVDGYQLNWQLWHDWGTFIGFDIASSHLWCLKDIPNVQNTENHFLLICSVKGQLRTKKVSVCLWILFSQDKLCIAIFRYSPSTFLF